MHVNNSDFINTSITKYLKEMITSFGYRTIAFEMQPLVSYLLSTTLLQMTGFLEKKLDLIMWELGSYDFDIRYDIIRNPKNLFSNYESLKNIYKYFKITKTVETELLEYYNEAYKAFRLIEALFDGTKIKDYTGQDFIYYKMLPIKTHKFHLNIINVKSENKMPVLRYLYDETIAYRNRIAHNISSIQPEIPSINHLKYKDVIYDNYFSRYMILTYFDLVFIYIYKEFIKNIKHVEL